jgi:hypothetical protein
MRKLLGVAALATLIATTTAASADEYVRGYTRQNGTYVAPHYRSSPDNSYNNNWSVRGNQNPYTGQYGTRAPTYNDRSPPRDTFSAPTYNNFNSNTSPGQRRLGW